ncbi:hypothetical protein ACIQTN_01980 [Streptomyces werraensis]|uniref:VG15 protein n=1 Tax=Streptomyces werraensis TaxID=68284 RepID=UPI00380A25D5
MATATAVQEFREAIKDVVALSERELRLFLLSLDFENVVATTNALEIFMPALVTEFGEVGAAVAVDFYDELRETSPAKNLKPYTAQMAEIPEQEAIQASVRWAVDPLWQAEQEPDRAISRLTEVHDRVVKAAPRNTIFESAQRDVSKALFARVPSGSKTCEFCLMLASRGAVYANAKSAGEAKKFHGHCDCQIIPMWDEDDYPEGYDPESLYNQYVDLQVSKQGH